MQTKGFSEKMEQMQKGASYPAVTDSDIRCQLIVFPKDQNEQQSILNKLDFFSAQTQALETHYRQKLTALEELKKSILQKAFAGELS